MAAYLYIPSTGEMEYFPNLVMNGFNQEYQKHKQDLIKSGKQYFIRYSDHSKTFIHIKGFLIARKDEYETYWLKFEELPPEAQTAFSLVI